MILLEENNHVSTSWSWCQTVIRTVIIVQPWSIVIMEALSSSPVMNCCCLWLDCLLDLTLKSTYCAAASEASICRPPVHVCALLCVTAPPAGAQSLSEPASNLSAGLECCSSKWRAGWVKLRSLSVLMVKQALLVFPQLRAKGRSAPTTQSPRRKACAIIFIIITVNILIVPQSLISSSWSSNSYLHLKSWENTERSSIPVVPPSSVWGFNAFLCFISM